jgi:putative lipoic acid-binding regulatory protein
MSLIPPEQNEEALFNFPCDFPIKVMGHRQDGFAQAIATVVLKHAPDFDVASMEMRVSKQGRYISLTCTIQATSRAQLDALYQDISTHPMVVMAL